MRGCNPSWSHCSVCFCPGKAAQPQGSWGFPGELSPTATPRVLKSNGGFKNLQVLVLLGGAPNPTRAPFQPCS